MPDIAQLVITSDGGVKRFPVGEGVYVIGRDPGCDLVIDSFFISRQHARITIAADHFILEDLASTSGTIVAGQSLSGKARFSYPQEVHLGSLSVEVKRLTATEPPPTEQRSNSSTTHYTPGKEIARGGMGAVLEANDDVLGRTVAMKVIRSGVGESGSMRLRFIREATVLARLEHPNIVPIHEMATDAEGRLFYTMKKVEGRTLQGVLDDLKQGESETVREYTLDRLLNVFRKVCDAMAFAHAQGVIHRDLKPENVMVGEYGEVLVMDWGLAKILQDETQTAQELAQTSQAQMSSEGTLLPTGFQELSDSQLSGSSQNLTMDGAVMGSPQYMPPEQAEGKVAELDERSDIFSLGGILYSILTLKAPVEGRSVKEVLDNVKSGKITPPTHYNTGSSTSQGGKKLVKGEIKDPKLIIPLPHCPGGRVPSALSSVTMKAMAFAPEDRYAEVEELAHDVEAYQRGFATSAEQVSAMGQVLLFVKRHKGVSISAGVALILIMVLSLGFMLKVNAEKNNALAEKTEADKAKLKADAEAGKAREAEAVAGEARKEAVASELDAKLSLIDALYRESDLGSMYQSLVSFDTEQRGDEWQYLDNRARNFSHKFLNEGRSNCRVAASPSVPGLFVVGFYNGKIWLVDGFNGEILKTYETRQKGQIKGIQFSASGDRLYLVTSEGGLFAVEVSTGKVKTIFSRDEFDLQSTYLFAMPPGEKRVFLRANEEDSVRLIDLSSKSVVKVGGAMSYAFVPASSDYLSVNGFSIERHAGDSQELVWRHQFDSAWVRNVSLSMTGETAYVVNDLGDVLALRARDGSRLWTLSAEVRSMPKVFSTLDDQALIVFGESLDGSPVGKVFGQRRQSPQMQLLGMQGKYFDAAYSREAGLLIAVGRDEVVVWEIPAGLEEAVVETQYSNFALARNDTIWRSLNVKDTRYHESWKHANNRVSIFDLKDGHSLSENILIDFRRPCIEGSRDGRRVVMGTHYIPLSSKVFPAHIFEEKGGEWKRIDFSLPSSPGRKLINRFDFSENGEVFLVNMNSGKTWICDSATGQPRSEIPHGHKGEDVMGAFHSNDQRVVTVANIGEGTSTNQFRTLIESWTLDGKKTASRQLAFDVLGIDASPDGRMLALACSDRRIRILETAFLEQDTGGATLFKFDFRAHDKAVTCVEFDPTGRYLVSGSLDQSVRVWNVKEGCARYLMRLALGEVTDVHFNPDGDVFAAHSSGRGILTWRMDANVVDRSKLKEFTATIEVDKNATVANAASRTTPAASVVNKVYKSNQWIPTRDSMAPLARHGDYVEISRDADYKVIPLEVGKWVWRLPGLMSGGDKLPEFAFHSQLLASDKPHIIIRLTKQSTLGAVRIVNRDIENLWSRAEGLTLWVSDDEDHWKEVWQADKVAAEWMVEFDKPIEARYLKLGIPGKGNLHLKSVTVFGKPNGLP